MAHEFDHLLTNVAWTLIHFLWQGALIGAVLWGLLASMDKRTSGERYVTRCLALGALALAPLGTFLTLHWSGLAIEPLPAGGTQAVLAGSPSGPLPSPPLPLNWIVGLWLVGVTVLLVRLVGGCLQVARLRRRLPGTPLSAPWQARFDQLAREFGVRARARIVQCASITAPTVIGWVRPVVLLPARLFTGFTDEQIVALLAHELAHVARRDYLVNIVQSIVEALLFYHPVVWWISQGIREEREYCCDDRAVAATHDGLAYARALTALEAGRGAQPQLGVSTLGGSLMNRIRRMVGKSPDPRAQRRPFHSLAAALAVGTLGVSAYGLASLPTPLEGHDCRCHCHGKAADSSPEADAPAAPPKEAPRRTRFYRERTASPGAPHAPNTFFYSTEEDAHPEHDGQSKRFPGRLYQGGDRTQRGWIYREREAGTVPGLPHSPHPQSSQDGDWTERRRFAPPQAPAAPRGDFWQDAEGELHFHGHPPTWLEGDHPEPHQHEVHRESAHEPHSSHDVFFSGPESHGIPQHGAGNNEWRESHGSFHLEAREPARTLLRRRAPRSGAPAPEAHHKEHKHNHGAHEHHQVSDHFWSKQEPGGETWPEPVEPRHPHAHHHGNEPHPHGGGVGDAPFPQPEVQEPIGAGVPATPPHFPHHPPTEPREPLEARVPAEPHYLPQAPSTGVHGHEHHDRRAPGAPRYRERRVGEDRRFPRPPAAPEPTEVHFHGADPSVGASEAPAPEPKRRGSRRARGEERHSRLM